MIPTYLIAAPIRATRHGLEQRERHAPAVPLGRGHRAMGTREPEPSARPWWPRLDWDVTASSSTWTQPWVSSPGAFPRLARALSRGPVRHGNGE